MDGVTILNTVEVARAPDWAVICFFLFAFFGAVFFILFLTSNTVKTINLCGIMFTCFFVIALVSWFIGRIGFPDRTIQYECVVEDSVSIVELYEKYDVVERRGDIWVLEEKTDGEID